MTEFDYSWLNNKRELCKPSRERLNTSIDDYVTELRHGLVCANESGDDYTKRLSRVICFYNLVKFENSAKTIGDVLNLLSLGKVDRMIVEDLTRVGFYGYEWEVIAISKGYPDIGNGEIKSEKVINPDM